MTASADTDTKRTLLKAERALNCFVFHSNPRVEDLLLFVGILDDRLALVKLLVPIDGSLLIGYSYHNKIIDLYKRSIFY